MFTLDQIKAIHARVKSGADFPHYVQDLKQLGMRYYDFYVADGHHRYVGHDGFTLTSPPSTEPLPVAVRGSAAQLAQALTIHQKGQTDYPTFCRQAAEAGVEKWTVEMQQLTCTYYDPQGNVLLAEAIPELQ